MSSLNRPPFKPFYLTEPYQSARRKAEADLANWSLAEQQEQYYQQRVKKENRDVYAILLAGLSFAIIILYLGIYTYVSDTHTNPPSPPIVHQSSGL